MGNKSRQDFRVTTVEVMAKRVGYICSNPNCRSSTIGPGSSPASIIKIGIAAHITAASPNGPRFDPQLTEPERISIENGIWLCSNCSILIDKDPSSFPVTLLNKWKIEAENEALQKIKGKFPVEILPRIQPDLIWSNSSRRNHGFSDKNKEMFGDGPYFVNLPLIMHWGITTEFTLHVFNNSSIPAYNVKILSEVPNLLIDSLPIVNNLPPLEKIELIIRYHRSVEGSGKEADKVMIERIPKNLVGESLIISFENESGKRFDVSYLFSNDGLEQC